MELTEHEIKQLKKEARDSKLFRRLIVAGCWVMTGFFVYMSFK